MQVRGQCHRGAGKIPCGYGDSAIEVEGQSHAGAMTVPSRYRESTMQIREDCDTVQRQSHVGTRRVLWRTGSFPCRYGDNVM
jgi:hypothetical protein